MSSGSCAPTAVPAPEEAPQQPSPPFPSLQVDGVAKKKRQRPPITHDQDVEVVALSPPALLGWNRWNVCETCGRGCQRRHVVKSDRLLEREAGEAAAPARKRVFVCPEPGCQYHAPSHALVNLPSLKKHFRRKHGGHGLWACGRGSGAVAVRAGYNARGTSGHTCDGCGYVEHQDTCGASRPRPEKALPPPAFGGGVVLGLAAANSTTQQQGQLHTVAGSPCSDDLVVSSALASPTAAGVAAASVAALVRRSRLRRRPPVPAPTTRSCSLCRRAGAALPSPPHRPAAIPRLDLSLGPGGARDDAAAARLMVKEAREQLLLAMAEKAAAEEDRAQARRREELAGLELASAQRMRQQAQVELSRAHAARQLVNARLLQVTCYTAAAGTSTPGLPH